MSHSYSALSCVFFCEPWKPVAPNLCISRIVCWTSNSTPLVEVGVIVESLPVDGMPRSFWSRREVDPPTVAKSGNAEGHTTTWTCLLRFFPELLVVSLLEDELPLFLWADLGIFFCFLLCYRSYESASASRLYYYFNDGCAAQCYNAAYLIE